MRALVTAYARLTPLPRRLARPLDLFPSPVILPEIGEMDSYELLQLLLRQKVGSLPFIDPSVDRRIGIRKSERPAQLGLVTLKPLYLNYS